MPKPEKIIPIILAAGPCPALPFPKALALFGKKTALHLAVENCSILSPPVVVLGTDAGKIAPQVPSPAQIIVNNNWRDGQLSSLQKALQTISEDAAFLIYPVDHPLLQQQTIRQLVRAFRTRSKSQQIVMPRHRDAYGHPVIVSAALRPEFFAAKTAREVIYRIPERIRVVPVRTPSIFQDFHTPESYQECLRKFTTRKRSKR